MYSFHIMEDDDEHFALKMKIAQCTEKKTIGCNYTWQAFFCKKKTINSCARNFSREIRCKKCKKFIQAFRAKLEAFRAKLGTIFFIFTHFMM